jgi:hypothetical protein
MVTCRDKMRREAGSGGSAIINNKLIVYDEIMTRVPVSPSSFLPERPANLFKLDESLWMI